MTAPTPSEFQRLIASVELEDVRMLEGWSRTRIGAEQVRPAELTMTPSTALRQAQPADGTLLVLAKLDASVGEPAVPSKESPSAEPLMSFRVVFELKYKLPPDLTFGTETLQQFAATNAVFNAWPYFREFLQSSTERMGLPKLILPVFRLRSFVPQSLQPQSAAEGHAPHVRRTIPKKRKTATRKS